MSEPGTTGLDPRLASVLAYSIGWVTGILFLLLERHDRRIRFHAAQSVVLFGTLSLCLILLAAASAFALLMSSASYALLRTLGQITWVAGAVAWVVLIVRAGRGEVWRVPVVAALADGMISRN